jgi:hypothetical protein
MTTPESNLPPEHDPWLGLPDALQKLSVLGWIEKAEIREQPSGGRSKILLTPLGKEKLKPFAELWHQSDGVREDTLLAIFAIACESWESKPPERGF